MLHKQNTADEMLLSYSHISQLSCYSGSDASEAPLLLSIVEFL